jgi:hypothetical protein
MIGLVALVVLLALYVALVACLDRGESGLAHWWKATAIAATIRIGVLWALVVLQWRRALGLWVMPVILVLLPEGLWLPRDFAWTIGRGLLVTALLLAGTALWTAMAVAVVRMFRRHSRPTAGAS